MGTSSASARVGSFIALYIIWLVSVSLTASSSHQYSFFSNLCYRYKKEREGQSNKYSNNPILTDKNQTIVLHACICVFLILLFLLTFTNKH